MADYLQSAFEELFNEDGLLVIARGLGLQKLLCKFLHLYNDRKRLVFCLNASQNEQVLLDMIMDEEGCPSDMLPISITNETSTKERASLYKKGGVFIITSRILIVDLLNNVVSSSAIDGLLIQHAHRVSDDSTEAFIVRIFRQHNQLGFVKALSEDPETLARGFNKLSSILRALHLKKIYLWPRFRVEVANELTPQSQEEEVRVEEISITLTPKMKVIQAHLVALIEACLVELRKCSRLETSELSVERALFKSFDLYLQRQLDAEWHKLSMNTKNMMSDIRTLRNLLDHLVRLDACTFYLLLLQLQSSSSASSSPWLMTAPASTVFATAQSRVYSLDQSGKVVLEVEDNMKWATVKHILTSQMNSTSTSSSSTSSNASYSSSVGDGGSAVLVVAHDDQTCRDLRDYLVDGFDVLAKRNFLRFIQNLSNRKKRTKPGNQGSWAKAKSGKGWAPTEQVKFSISGAELAALEAFEPSLNAQTPEDSNGGGDKKRVKKENKSTKEPELNEAELIMATLNTWDSVPSLQPQTYTAEPLSQPHIAIHSYGHVAEHENILNELQPLVIVMADPNQTFIRLVERYQTSLRGQRKVVLYLLAYGGSSEEQRYLSSIKREKDAFKRLIAEKGTMLVPLPVTHAPSSTQNDAIHDDVGEVVEEQRIVVDVREFRSSLPSFLHEKGARLDAVTLTVGDFVLSPNICIERKSISDMFGSFKSGRLFNQAESMARFYRTPTLLIEFSTNKPFILQTANEIKSTVELNNICTKICLLVMAFPQLRLVWSRDPRSTVDLFYALKLGQPSPTLDTALTCGGESVEPANQSAEEILQRLPGITIDNYRRVVEGVENLQELFQMNEAQLTALIGNPVSARALFRFINQPAPV